MRMTFYRAVIVIVASAATGFSQGESVIPEISATVGDTVHIPCSFGDGVVRNIFWKFGNVSETVTILTLFRDEVHAVDTRLGLQDDRSTLTIRDVTLQDEGRYSCDVDRNGTTTVRNIRTELAIFSLLPDTLPEITNCINVNPAESTPCVIQASGNVTLTCSLSEVYPVNDTTVKWYQDGRLLPSTDLVLVNNDNSANLSSDIDVSESGNFTCNASFMTVNGTAITTRSARVVMADGGSPLNGNNNMIYIIVLAVSCLIVAAIIVVCIVLKKRGTCQSADRGNNRRELPLSSGHVQDSLLGQGVNTGSNGSTRSQIGGNQDISHRGSELVACSDEISDTEHVLSDNAASHQPSSINFDDVLKRVAKRVCTEQEIDTLGVKLGFETEEIQCYIKTNLKTQQVTNLGTLEMLRDWRKKQTAATEGTALETALKAAGQIRLADDLFS